MTLSKVAAVRYTTDWFIAYAHGVIYSMHALYPSAKVYFPSYFPQALAITHGQGTALHTIANANAHHHIICARMVLSARGPRWDCIAANEEACQG